MVNFGSVSIKKVKTLTGLKRLIKSIPKSEVYLIKPNWYSPYPAGFTGSKAIGMLIDALPGPSIVIEGHSLDRQNGTKQYSVLGKKVDWKWLLKNPDWKWMEESNSMGELRRQEKWFLDTHGITETLENRGVDYLNITEEIWSGRSENPERVKNVLGNSHPPILRDKIYGFMPSKLARLKGNTLVSLCRVKGFGGRYPSLSIKNLFGLIPDPMRSWWHGVNDCDLSHNIIDIARLYKAYFNLFGVCEAIDNFTVDNPEGEVKVPWGAYSVAYSEGFASCGSNLIELDAVLCNLIKVDPEKVGYICLGEGLLGEYNRVAVKKASAFSGLFFNPKNVHLHDKS